MKGNKTCKAFFRELPCGERQYFAPSHSSSPSSRLKAAAIKLERASPVTEIHIGYIIRCERVGTELTVSRRVVPRSYKSLRLFHTKRVKETFLLSESRLWHGSLF